jgi:hypothetical protein
MYAFKETYCTFATEIKQKHINKKGIAFLMSKNVLIPHLVHVWWVVKLCHDKREMCHRFSATVVACHIFTHIVIDSLLTNPCLMCGEEFLHHTLDKM